MPLLSTKMPKGKFIVFEGVDGSGKSTQAKLLAEYLKTKGKKVILTAEPTKGFIGQIIRMILNREIPNVEPRTLALLFTADRAEHLEKIVKPALEKGKVVISERYYYSTLAYQSSQGLPINWLQEINDFVIEPDLVILLEINPDEALARMDREKDIFEVADFQHEVQKELIEFAYRRYKKLKFFKSKHPWKVVKSTGNIGEVQEKIREAVDIRV